VATVCRERAIFGALPGKDSLQAHKSGDAITPTRTT
jgi:hypothetical protein